MSGGSVGGEVKSGAIRTEKVIAERSRLEDGEAVEVVVRETEGLVAFEFLVFLPSGGLKKMLIHEFIIA